MGITVTNAVLVVLQSYFLFMNFTVEKSYCERELKAGDTGFLIPETVEFCIQHNPLFLERPDWLRNATCISAYIFPLGYFFILWVAAMNHWSKFYVTVPVLLFVGIKLNAIYFYHFMEFTSHTPPQNLIPYFSAEGPYIVSMFVVIYQTMDALASQRGRLAAAEQIIRESFTTKLTEKKKK